MRARFLLILATVAALVTAARAEAQSNSIVPRPQAPDPRPFTLENRYLDAASRADLETLKVCLDKGVSLGTKDDFGRTALLLAVMTGRNLELVKFLQQRGLGADEPDIQSRAPLAYA